MKQQVPITVLLLLLGVASALVTGVEALFVDSHPNSGNSFGSDTLEPPTSLTATASASSILLDWVPTPDTYASGRRIFRGTASGGPYSQIAEVTPRSATSYTDSTAVPGLTYYYIARSFYENWESVNSNEASATIPAGVLNLQENDTDMSTATSPAGNIDTNDQQTDYFKATSPVVSASNGSDWTLVLVLRDKPDALAPATVNIWWQNGGICSTGAVAGQTFASASVSVPIAVDRLGVTFTVTKTGGTVSRTFQTGDILCMSISADGVGGAYDLHYYANTASTSGVTGVSRLEGPFTQDATLDPPTGVTAATGAAEGVIDLSWTPTVDSYADGYRVFRSATSGGPYTQIADVPSAAATGYQDSGLNSGTYYYVVRSYWSITESANSNEAAASTIPVLYVHSDFSMSGAPASANKIDVNHGQTKYFTASSGVATASNATDWTLVMVMRDKPTEASPATINIWWQSGGACSGGPVGGQVLAGGTVTVPLVTAQYVGVSVTVPKTGGTVDRTFVAGDLLCMSMTADGPAGANDIHFYGDTPSTSGVSGVSRLKGPFTQ